MMFYNNNFNQIFIILYDSHTDNCLLDGVLEIATCKEGAPVVTSCPHFYMADPIYVKAVDGMNPQPLMHQTYLDIEPVCYIDCFGFFILVQAE